MIVRAGDLVKVTAGSQLGKTGTIEAVLLGENRVIVTGLNTVKRHLRKSTKHPAGAIVTKLAPINASNVQIICPNCQKATKVAIRRIDNKRYRICKKCQSTIDKQGPTR